MDHKIGVFDPPKLTGSFGRSSSGGSSIRRRSLSLSKLVPLKVDNDEDCESVSEAGDIGDRALHSNRCSESGSFRNLTEIEMVTENVSFNSNGFPSRNSVSLVSPLPEETRSPLPTDPMVCSEDKKQVSFNKFNSLLC